MAFGRNGDTSFIEKSMDGAGGWNLDTTVYGADIIGIPLDGPDKGKHKLFDGIHTFAQLSYVEDMGGGGGGAVGSDDVSNESTVPGSTVTDAFNNVRVAAVTWSDANNPGGSGAFVPAVNQLVYITDGDGAGRIYRGNGSEDLIELIALDVYSTGAIATGNTVWVDAVNGDDDTGQAGRMDRPFETIEEARDAASAGDVVHVRSGTFSEVGIAKNGVSYLFDPNATINYVGSSGLGVIDDSSGPIVAKFIGGNNIRWESSGASDAGTINVVDEDSDIEIEAGKLSALWTGNSSPGHGPGVIWGVAGKLKVRATEVVLESGDGQYDGEYVIGWTDGTLHVVAHIIRSEMPNNLGGVAAVSSPATTSGEFWVEAQQIRTQVSMQCPGSDARMWVRAMDITINSDGGQAVYASGGRLYVQAMRIKNENTGGGIRNEGGILWLNSQKVTASGETGQAVSLIDGTTDADILEIEDGGGLGTGIYCEFGTHVVKNVRFVSGADTVAGVSISGGTLILENCVIDTSASATGNPVAISGGTLILRNTKLIPNAARNAIESGGSHTVQAENSKYTVGVSAGISFEGTMHFDQGAPSAGDVPTANADGSWSWA